MSENLNRRSFLKKSVIASTAATLTSGSEGKTLSAKKKEKPDAPMSEDSAKALPLGRIGKLKISRLICGGNQFSGWSHSRDLTYLRELFRAYSTDEKIMETLQICEENGINTIITASAGYLKKYWKERGGHIQWIAQVHPKSNDLTTNIKSAIDNGAVELTYRVVSVTNGSDLVASTFLQRHWKSLKKTELSPVSEGIL